MNDEQTKTTDPETPGTTESVDLAPPTSPETSGAQDTSGYSEGVTDPETPGQSSSESVAPPSATDPETPGNT